MAKVRAGKSVGIAECVYHHYVVDQTNGMSKGLPCRYDRKVY
jgi:hypothetical protein